MKHVNFLTQKSNKKILELNLLVFLLVFLGLLCVTISYSYFKKYEIAKLVQKKEDLARQMGPLRAHRLEVKSADKKTQVVLPEILTSRVSLGQLLKNVTQATPRAVRLDSINAHLGEKERLVIQATSKHLNSATLFKQQIESFSWCKKGDLVSLNHQDLDDKNTVFGFRIECGLRE